MWNLIKTEVNYSKRNLILLSFITVFVLIFESYKSDWDLFMAYVLLPFFAVYYTVVHTSREKREQYYSLLPVSAVKIALFRIIMIVFPFAAMIALYYGFHTMVRVETESESTPWIAFMGLYIFGFSLYLLRRDLKLKSLPSNRTFPVAKFTLLAIVTLLLLGTVILTMLSAGSGETPLFIEYIGRTFDILFSRNGAIAIYAVTACLFGLSVFTYLRRKSFLTYDLSCAW